MKCDRCSSERIVIVSGKTSDRCFIDIPHLDRENDGYVPDGLGITDEESYGDYINMEYCLECGKIQGNFPIHEDDVERITERWCDHTLDIPYI